MQNSKVLITGATDGIGKETARALAQMGAKVIVHGRSPKRIEQTVSELQQTTSADIFSEKADLASLNDIRQMAQRIIKKHPDLNILINNAGVFMNHYKETQDGFETTFVVNHLAYFLLTNSLLDTLKKNSPARIINVSSMAHSGSDIDFSDLNMKRDFDGFTAYSRSKLANILFTYELSERLQGIDVTVNALHPGVIGTKLLHEGWGFGGNSNIMDGAKLSIYLASSSGVIGVSGKYFSDMREQRSSSQSYSKDVRKKLWDISADMVGLNY